MATRKYVKIIFLPLLTALVVIPAAAAPGEVLLNVGYTSRKTVLLQDVELNVGVMPFAFDKADMGVLVPVDDSYNKVIAPYKFPGKLVGHAVSKALCECKLNIIQIDDVDPRFATPALISKVGRERGCDVVMTGDVHVFRLLLIGFGDESLSAIDKEKYQLMESAADELSTWLGEELGKELGSEALGSAGGDLFGSLLDTTIESDRRRESLKKAKLVGVVAITPKVIDVETGKELWSSRVEVLSPGVQHGGPAYAAARAAGEMTKSLTRAVDTFAKNRTLWDGVKAAHENPVLVSTPAHEKVTAEDWGRYYYNSCPKCKRGAKTGDLFCSYCGASLKREMWKCTACGAENVRGGRYCTKCGAVLAPVTKTKERTQIKTAPAATAPHFCIYCGEAVEANTKFCPKCGKRVE